MNITRRLKSFTALALSLCMGLQFYPVLGEETTEPVTTDLSTSTSVDWSLKTYIARKEGADFALGLTFEEGTVLHAGDTMSLALPEGYSFSDITEALPLYAMRDGVPGEMLASYTISGNVLSLVFNEVTDLTGVTTELTVTGTPVETQTEGYYKEHTWTMENDSDGTVNTVSFNVPASDIMNWTASYSSSVEYLKCCGKGTALQDTNPDLTAPLSPDYIVLGSMSAEGSYTVFKLQGDFDPDEYHNQKMLKIVVKSPADTTGHTILLPKIVNNSGGTQIQSGSSFITADFSFTAIGDGKNPPLSLDPEPDQEEETGGEMEEP